MKRRPLFLNKQIFRLGRGFQLVQPRNFNRVRAPAIVIDDTITMSSGTSGATIYYTTDGSTPDATKTEYTGEIALPEVTTIYKAIAVKADMDDSAIRTAVYTISTEPIWNPWGTWGEES